MNVHEHLTAASRLPWRWGGGEDGFEGEDCTLFAANWALALSGRDPGAGIRGMYSTERQAIAIVARAGGMEAFVDRQLRQAEWIRIGAQPRDGDIGVVLAPLPPNGELGQVPAIRAGGMWVARTQRGQIGHSFETLSVWRWGDHAQRDLGPPPPREAAIVRSHAQQCAGSSVFTVPHPAQMQQTGVIELYIFAGLVAAGVAAPPVWLTTALAYLAVTAVVTSLSMLTAPKPPKPEDGKAPKAQPIPPRIYIIGTARVGGFYMLWEEYRKVLYSVIALCGHPVTAINTIYLHDDVVTRVGTTVQGQTDGRYGNNLINIDTRLGAVPETAYGLVTAGLASQNIWTANHRGDGQASLAMTCKSPGQEGFPKRFPNGIPQPSAVIDGAKVWDYRDPAQNPEDPSTWVFSRNSALNLCWHECFNPFGTRRDYRRAILPVLDMWKEEADICDELVATADGGTEPRYRVNGWATTEVPPKTVQNAILASCDGWLCERGDGALLFRVGKFREELVGTITDEDIAGYYVQNDVAEEDEVNRLVPKFTYPATDYTTTDTDFFEDIPAQLKAGRVLSEDADFGWVHDWRQARRLGFREFKRLRQRMAGALDLKLSGINPVYNRWNRIQSTTRVPRLNGVVIENRRARLSLMQGGFQMEFVRHPDDLESFDPLTDEGQQPPVPEKPGQVAEELPNDLDVIAVANGTSVYLLITIDEPDTGGIALASVTPVVHYRIKDTGGGSAGPWVEQRFATWTAVDGRVELATNPVPSDERLQVQAAFISPRGSYSDWAPEVPAEIVSTIDPVAPDPVEDVVGSSPGAGEALIQWQAPNSGNYQATNIRRNTVDDEGSATLVRTEFGPASSADSWTDEGLAAGSYFYWLKSRNSSGVESATSVPTGEIVVS